MISGEVAGEKRSLCGEKKNGGKETIKLNSGAERKFLADGDIVSISGACGDEGEGLVGFGVCEG